MMMIHTAHAIGSALLPYVIWGTTEWIIKATDTWVPAYIANQTIFETGRRAALLFGGNSTFAGRVAGVAGRVIGGFAAPFAVQNTIIKSYIHLGGQVVAVTVSSVIQFSANRLMLNRTAHKIRQLEAEIASLRAENKQLRGVSSNQTQHARVHQSRVQNAGSPS